MMCRYFQLHSYPTIIEKGKLQSDAIFICWVKGWMGRSKQKQGSARECTAAAAKGSVAG